MGSWRLPKCDAAVKQVKPYWYISASFFPFSLFLFDFSIFLTLIFFSSFFFLFCFLVGVVRWGDGLLFSSNSSIYRYKNEWWTDDRWDLLCQKNYYASLPCPWLNISQLEAALPAVRALHVSFYVSLPAKHCPEKREAVSGLFNPDHDQFIWSQTGGPLSLSRQTTSKTGLSEQTEPPSQPLRPTALRNHSHLA